MFSVLSFSLFTLLPTIVFQEPAKPKPTAKETYLPKLIFIQNAKADDLAKSLQKAFGSSVTIQPTTGSSVSGLLVSGPPAAVDTAIALIEKLDQPAKEIALELVIVESAGVIDLPAPEPEKVWSAKLSKLQKDGVSVSVRRISLNLLENRESKIAATESRPLSTGMMGPRGAVGQRSFTYTNFGTTVTAKARLEAPKEVVVDLTVEDSRSMRTPPGPSDSPEEFLPDSMGKLRIEGSAKLRAGQVVKIQSNQEQVKSNQQQIMIFLIAK